jgi:hypothetical protein
MTVSVQDIVRPSSNRERYLARSREVTANRNGKIKTASLLVMILRLSEYETVYTAEIRVTKKTD